MLSLILAIIVLTIIPSVFFVTKAYELHDSDEKGLFWLHAGVSVGFIIDALVMFFVYKPYV